MTNSVVFEPDLREYGGRGSVLQKIENPDWNCREARHDWRCDVPWDVRRAWNVFALETRLAVYLMAVRSEDWG